MHKLLNCDNYCVKRTHKFSFTFEIFKRKLVQNGKDSSWSNSMGGAFIQGETERAAKKGPFKLFLLKKRAFFAALPKQAKVLWVKKK